ncbi:MAG: DUF2341 domain-containing protein [Dehalococcoidales bacterium]|jgi:hypothetical protein
MLSGWTKSLTISLYNNNTTLTDYQVKFIINRSSGTNSGDNIYIGTDCEADYDDIRFSSTSDVEYPYWIESYDASTATIWVKVPTLTSNSYTDIVLQYGNASATTTSSGTNTFVFFDDFDTLDTAKWTVGGTPTVASSQITINAGSEYIIGKTGYAANYEIIGRGSLGASNNLLFGFQASYEGTPLITFQYGYLNGSVYNTRSYNSTTQDTSIGASYTGTRTWRIKRYSSSIAYYVGSTLVATHSTQVPTSTLYPILAQPTTGSGSSVFDAIAIHAITASEPTKYYRSPLTDWSYKQTHSITHGTGLTDYQVQFTVYKTSGTSSGSSIYCNTHCNDDFSDIRFSVDDVTALPYWIESYTSGVSAKIWVKLPTIGTTTIAVFYGNAAATSESNGDATFVFFDDFEGATLDTAKWNPTLVPHNSGTGTVAVSGGAITITQTAGVSKGIGLSSLNALADNTNTIRVKVNSRSTGSSSTAQVRISVTSPTTPDPGSFGIYINCAESRHYLHNYQGVGEPYITETFVTSTPVTYDFQNNVTNPKFYKNDVLGCTGTGNPTDPAGNYIRIWLYSTTTATVIDWIVARKYAATEPTQGSWSAELGNISQITFAPSYPDVNESIAFSLISDMVPVSYLWNFGDNSHSTSSNPTKIYSEFGTKPVALTVKYNDESFGTYTTNVPVSYVYPTYGANITIYPEIPYETEVFTCSPVNIVLDPSIPVGTLTFERTIPIPNDVDYNNHFPMAIDFDGNFYHTQRKSISGHFNIILYKYNSAGTLLKSVTIELGTSDTTSMKFNEDCSVLYILLRGGIFQYDKELNFIRSWWSSHHLMDCFAIKDGYIYGSGSTIGTYRELFVSVHDNLGNYIRQFGDGSIIRDVVNIFLDNTDNIWIAEWGLDDQSFDLLQKFTNDGTFIASYIPHDMVNQKFFMENNTSTGHIYVSGWNNTTTYGVIDVYDSSVNYICSYTGSTSIIQLPYSMRSNNSSDEKLYVFDSGPYKVQIYKFTKGYSLKWISEDNYVSSGDTFATDCTSPTSTYVTLEITDLNGNVYPTVTPFIEVVKRNLLIDVSFTYTKSE